MYLVCLPLYKCILSVIYKRIGIWALWKYSALVDRNLDNHISRCPAWKCAFKREHNIQDIEDGSLCSYGNLLFSNSFDLHFAIDEVEKLTKNNNA